MPGWKSRAAAAAQSTARIARRGAGGAPSRSRERAVQSLFAWVHGLAKLGKLTKFKILQIFGGLILGCIKTKLFKKMRLTTFFKLYKIRILLHRRNLKILAKNRFQNSAIFVKIQQKFCKCRTICKILLKINFKNFR